MSDSEEDMLFLATVVEAEEEEKEKLKRKHKFWVHEINTKRLRFGEHHHLFPDLLTDEKKFLKYFRMSPEKFYELLELIKNNIIKKDTTFRKAISPEERLSVMLRFLATGDTFDTIAFSYRLGEKSVRRIVYKTCEAIWTKLSPTYMCLPNQEQWRKIEEGFRTRWNFPNCIGSIDGKHVVINKPYHSGSLFFNYKKMCSLVLMAVVGAECRFIMIDVGGYGKNSDDSIFANSNFGERLREEKLDFPNDIPLPGTEEPMPYVIVGDEAFPLHKNLMRPYPGNALLNDEGNKIFNYRLSRARNTSEGAFGILSKRFRVYQRRLEMKPIYVNKIVRATCCLHNFLKSDSPMLLAEVIEDEIDATIPESWALQNLRNVGGSFSGIGYATRQKFRDYFLSPNGSVEWQNRVVLEGRRYD